MLVALLCVTEVEEKGWRERGGEGRTSITASPSA